MQQRTIPYILLTLILSILAMGNAYAEGDDTAEFPVYIELKPDFIVNYSISGARLKYIKTSITLRAKASSAEVIQLNMPIVRDAIVMFLSELKAAQVSGALAREQSRKDVLTALNAALKEETGQEPVMDVLFASFVTQ